MNQRHGIAVSVGMGLLLALAACRGKPEQGDPRGDLDECEDRPQIVDCASGDTGTKDYDGDGVSNCRDDDIDGDGVHNALDCDPYNSAADLMRCVGDLGLKDYDGDGVRNCRDDDIDGDGIENEHDGSPYDALGVPPMK